jgi:cytoskeleton protein RodZ
MVMMDGSGSTETNRAAGGGLAEIGTMLRRRREEVGQDLATISAITHIKPMFLKAIEEGRRKDLPGTAYMIGYIRTYADYLGFDGNRLITDYHAELAGQRKWVDKRAEPVEPPPVAAAALSQIQANPVVVLGGVVVLALAAYGAWSILSGGGESEKQTAEVEAPVEQAPADPAPSEQPEATAAQPASPSPTNPTNAEASTGAEATAPAEQAPPAETAPAEAPAAAEDQVPPEADVASTGEEVVEESPPQQEAAAEAEGQAGKIVVRARLESWIQITNGKKEVVFSRVLRSGETYTVPEEKGLMLTTGNAGGIEISVDGQKLKSLGTVGLVKRDIPLDAKKLRDGSAFKTSKAAPVTN